MPKREDDTYRYMHGHPSSCTCVDCTKQRMSQLIVCPICNHKSLFLNHKTHLYECMNEKCKRRCTELELDHTIPANRMAVIRQKTAQRKDTEQETEHKEAVKRVRERRGGLIGGIALIFFGTVSPFIWPLYFTMLIPFIPIPYAGNVFLTIAGLVAIYYSVRQK